MIYLIDLMSWSKASYGNETLVTQLPPTAVDVVLADSMVMVLCFCCHCKL